LHLRYKTPSPTERVKKKYGRKDILKKKPKQITKKAGRVRWEGGEEGG
jgi:hypothetical protein